MSKAKLKTFSHMNKSGAPKKEPPKRLYLRPTVHCLHRWLLSQRQGNSARKRCSPIHWVRYLGLWPLLMAPWTATSSLAKELQNRAEMGNEHRSIRPDHRVQQWRRFLSNPENKQQLIHFTINEWRKERCSVKLAGKKQEKKAMNSRQMVQPVLCEELRSKVYTSGGRHKAATTHISCRKKWLCYSRDFIWRYSALRSRASFPRQCIWKPEHRPEQGISTSHMLFSSTVQSCTDVFLGYKLLLVVTA